jgi:hypothetical protein
MTQVGWLETFFLWLKCGKGTYAGMLPLVYAGILEKMEIYCLDYWDRVLKVYWYTME